MSFTHSKDASYLIDNEVYFVDDSDFESVDNKLTTVDTVSEAYLFYNAYSCNKSYEKNYWKRIENYIVRSRARINIEELYAEVFNGNEGIATLDDYCNLYEILVSLKGYDFSSNTLINFIRHFPVLDDYICYKNYDVSADSDSIRFHLWKNNINLIINFNSNYLVDFYSYDNDSDTANDKLIYSMKGTFSSSSDLNKSYKVERLLAILDGWEEEVNNKWIDYSRFAIEQSDEFSKFKITNLTFSYKKIK